MSLTKCRLCLKESRLQGSHIIPRAFLKSIKKDSPQLEKMELNTDVKLVSDNANWNQPLLCAGCESLINMRYERSQIAYLRDLKKLHIHHEGRVSCTEFNFRKFYLFWLSILWRASVSDMPEFETVDLGEGLNEVIRRLIYEENLDYNGSCISESLIIGVIRLLPSGIFDADMVKMVITNFDYKQNVNGLTYYLLVEGFLVSFLLRINKVDLPKDFGRLKNTYTFRMPALTIEESPVARSMFDRFIDKISQHL